MRSLNIRTIKPIAILFVAFAVTYHKALSIFFVQDELHGIGAIVYLGKELIFHRFAPGEVNHFVPINSLIGILLYNSFGLNYVAYNLAALALHFLNAILVYILAYIILKNKHLALLASLLFVLSSNAAQLVMWPIIGTNTIALSPALVAFIIFVKYLDTQKHTVRTGIAVSALTLISLMTIEYSGGLIVFFPLAAALAYLVRKINFKRLLQLATPFAIMTLFYVLVRFRPFAGAVGASPAVTHGGNLKNLMAQFVKFPLKYFGQLLLPSYPIELFTKALSTRLGIGGEVWMGRFLIITGGVVLLILSLLARRLFSYKQKLDEKAYFLSVLLLFIFASALPFILIPGGGGIYIFPSRYLYFGLAGYAILFPLVLGMLSGRLIRKMLTILIFVLMFFGITGNIIKSYQLAALGVTRKSILSVIQKSYPELPDKAVIFTMSDTSYYGLPDRVHILPFQSGFGQTLLIHYNQKKALPKDFFKDNFLWEITDQGYRQVGDHGFGYYWDFMSLAKDLENKKFGIDDVISYYYDSEIGLLKNNSDNVRGWLEGYLADKKLVDQSFDVKTTFNGKEIGKIIDGDRNTYWSSEVPYSREPFIDIDLLSQKVITSIKIDSNEDINQDKIGYRILLSIDGQSWEEVFYAKSYPPDKEGLLTIYFRPTHARYIKIMEIGKHNFAPWRIAEISLYEAK